MVVKLWLYHGSVPWFIYKVAPSYVDAVYICSQYHTHV